MKGIFKKTVSMMTASALFAGILGVPAGRLEAATPEDTLRREVAGLIANQDDEATCDNSKACSAQRGVFDRLALSRQWEEILNVFQAVQGHPEDFSSDLANSVSAYLGMVESLKTQLSALGYSASGPATPSITATAQGPVLNGRPLDSSGMTVDEKSSLMRLIFKDASQDGAQAVQSSRSASLRGVGLKNPFVASDMSAPEGGGGGGDWGHDTSGQEVAEVVTDVATAAGIGVAVGTAVAVGAVATAVALTVGVVIAAIVTIISPDESPDQVVASPELRAALEPMVQQLLQHPQGGVKGGQVDPIAQKESQTYEGPDSGTKLTVSPQQKQTLLNQARFGSGFIAPVSSRNGGGGMPTEIGGKIGSPIFMNSGGPVPTGCAAGRPCR